MNHVETIETGLVYRNPKPHVFSRHAYFPSLVRCDSGELVCGFDIGSAFEASDVRSFVSRSSDDGKTWSAPMPVLETTPEQRISTSCRLSQVSGGEIVGLASLMDRSRENEGLANPATEGFVYTEFALVRSRDHGRSFSALEPITPPMDWSHFEICSPIMQTQSGRWLAPTSIWPDWEGRSPLGRKAIAFISDDRGRTWPKFVNVMSRPDEHIAFYEQKLVPFGEDQLLAVCWTVHLDTRSNRPIHMAISRDDGATFSDPVPTPLLGETCAIRALEGNRLLCVYRREDQRGLWAHVAEIRNGQWKPIAELPLWGGQVQSHDISHQSMMAQMSTLRFGCPTIARLTNDHVLVAFWCVEDAVSNIRWIRLAVR